MDCLQSNFDISKSQNRSVKQVGASSYKVPFKTAILFPFIRGGLSIEPLHR